MTSYAFDFYQTLYTERLGPNEPMLQLARDLISAGHPVHVISHARTDQTIRHTKRKIAELDIPFASVHVGRFGPRHRQTKADKMQEIGADVIVDDTPAVCERARQSGLRAIETRKCDPRREIAVHGIDGDASRQNIVVLGTGRCGTSIATAMLHRLGWRWGNVDRRFAEHITVRAINDKYHRTKRFDSDRAEKVVKSLPEPWILKDPRFVWTLDYWRPFFGDALLFWITRDLSKTRASFDRKRWLVNGRSRGATIPQLHERCGQHFEQWTGPKLRVDFDDIKRAVGLFDTSRG